MCACSYVSTRFPYITSFSLILPSFIDIFFCRINVKTHMVQMDMQGQKRNVCLTAKTYVVKRMNNVHLQLFHVFEKYKSYIFSKRRMNIRICDDSDKMKRSML